MNVLFDALHARGSADPQSIALVGSDGEWRHADLWGAVERLAAGLAKAGVRRLGLLAENGPGWIVADLAALGCNAVCVPLPTFFHADQRAHAAADAGLDAILAEPGLAVPVGFAAAEPVEIGPLTWRLYRTQPARLPALPSGTVKITYTSGTTGSPRGVCVGAEGLLQVARALSSAISAHPGDRSLNLLPLSTLLENLAGVYAPLLAGARVVSLPPALVGVSGSSGFDPVKALIAAQQYGATALVTVPQMLLALTLARAAGAPRPAALRFVAVGGASVAPGLIAQARAAGLPAYEGYGLSECLSVVALNRPGADRPGSVGRPLPDVVVSVGADGEIHVGGRAFLGYVGADDAPDCARVATGDLGHFDADGFLHVTGRRRNVIVNGWGRNLSPEWVERELLAHPAIAQAVVFGDAQPYPVALIEARGGADQTAVAAAVSAANRHLPDYAQVGAFAMVGPWSPGDRFLTANGRPRRDAIRKHYAQDIEALYAPSTAPTQEPSFPARHPDAPK